jgi:hypothetical protein
LAIATNKPHPTAAKKSCFQNTTKLGFARELVYNKVRPMAIKRPLASSNGPSNILKIPVNFMITETA